VNDVAAMGAGVLLGQGVVKQEVAMVILQGLFARL